MLNGGCGVWLEEVGHLGHFFEGYISPWSLLVPFYCMSTRRGSFVFSWSTITKKETEQPTDRRLRVNPLKPQAKTNLLSFKLFWSSILLQRQEQEGFMSKSRSGMEPEMGAKTWMFLWLVSTNHFTTLPNRASWGSHNPKGPESQLSFQDVSFLPICLQWPSSPCTTLPGFCGQCLLCGWDSASLDTHSLPSALPHLWSFWRNHEQRFLF